MTKKSVFILISTIITTSLFLAACGGAVAPQATAAPRIGNLGSDNSGGGDAATQPAGDNTPTAAAPAPAADSGTTPAPAKGNMLADLGFRSDKDGFIFQNYGPGFTDLTPEEMNRIYGDVVCANKTDGKCTLIPPAQQWMEQVNTAMSGGHCYGFAAASLLFYKKSLNTADFGGSSMADLKIEGNDKLQRELAKDWTGQKFDTVRSQVIGGTPVQVLDKLIDALKAGTSGESYIFAFFKRDGSGGHAVTPFAVEDRGNGINAVLLYDNNYPKDQREMIVDRNANTWKYEASINPSVKSELYEGDAQTQSLYLYPVSPAASQQACTFCAAGPTASKASGLASAPSNFNEIWMDGAGDLLITDKAGHKLGRVDGKMVNEIPGASYEINLSDTYSTDVEPTYRVPADVEFEMSIDGTNLKEKTQTNVVVIGPGYDLGVEGIALDPGQKDTMNVSTTDNRVSYQTTSSESPSFIIGLQRAGADYEFDVKGAAMDGGGTLNVYIDPKKGDLVVNAEEIKKDASIGMVMTRIDDKTEETFENDAVSLKAGDLLYVDYADWKGNNTPINMTIMDSKGTVLDQFSSADQK